MAKNDPTVTLECARQHGLGETEYQKILSLLQRTPTKVEIAIFSSMWNEHCSYKSSRKWLRTLPTQGQHVIRGPGENAGVIDIGDGEAIVFKMESHNHPSFIEPYQGASTGVGGILRDVFTMGARPVALLNTLFFGSPDHPRTRHFVSEVVRGIGSYGNSFGTPTIGGQVTFHPGYNGNILVNAMAVGIVHTDRIFYSKADAADLPIVYLGAKTGREGIHGSSMASAGFSDTMDEQRSTIQTSDPFTGKCLLEACLELMDSGSIIAIQDMGAAGLTSSAVEIGSGSGLGVEIDVSRVPCRADGMTPYEIMLSETQERMLLVIRPGTEHHLQAICRKWNLDWAVIGRTTDDLRFIVKHEETLHADLPIEKLASESPEYDLPWTPHTAATPLMPIPDRDDLDYADLLCRIMGSPALCSRRWVWEQYDSLVMGRTIRRPGGDAAVIRIGDGMKGIAACTDVTPRYCLADPMEGGKQAVVEVWRNLTAVGADPIAVTDNLNFGNPNCPETMGCFVEAIRGIAEACQYLRFPIVSGNVSLYNETNGQPIPPTPSIGGIGLIPDIQLIADIAFRNEDDLILLVGPAGRHLGQSVYLHDLCNQKNGLPPKVDMPLEQRNGHFIRWAIRSRFATSVHDISDGGMIVALAEMVLAGRMGALVELPPDVESKLGFLFGEDQSRYLLTCHPDHLSSLSSRAKVENIALTPLGKTGGDHIHVKNLFSLPITTLEKPYEAWFPDYMLST